MKITKTTNFLKLSQMTGPNGPVGPDNPRSDDLGLSPEFADPANLDDGYPDHGWKETRGWIETDLPENVDYESIPEDIHIMEDMLLQEHLPFEYTGSHDQSTIFWKWVGEGEPSSANVEVLQAIVNIVYSDKDSA